MGNMHLVTGYQGQEHVTAADHGSLYAAIFGQGSYVLGRGNMFAATLIASNKVRIADGDLVIQGRHVRLNEGKTVDLTIENGSQGRNRIDIIAARYTRNASTGVEDANLVVIKGTASTSEPTFPSINEGDILYDHALTADFPLYFVYLNGVTIEYIEPMFSVAHLVTVGYDGKIPSEYLPSMNYIPTSYRGAANGVASLDSSGKIPSAQLPSMNYIPTTHKGAASGVAPLNANKKIDRSYLPEKEYEVKKGRVQDQLFGQPAYCDYTVVTRDGVAFCGFKVSGSSGASASGFEFNLADIGIKFVPDLSVVSVLTTEAGIVSHCSLHQAAGDVILSVDTFEGIKSGTVASAYITLPLDV